MFDITSSKTRIPSVILLLALGWIVGGIVELFGINVPPGLVSILPILGTIGLILIVLEGALELELNRSKVPVLTKTFLSALLPILILSFGLAYVISATGNYSFKDSLTNAIPLGVISSAIAIPSVKNLGKEKREFVIYESSLSDILGVVLFNFVALNNTIRADSFIGFLWQMLAIILISFFTTGALSFLLSKIEHHVKFVPIILLVILIYEISKVFHLPALIFILVFGLFLGNLDEVKRFKWIQKLRPDELNKEVKQFKYLTIEAAFLIRALFFLLFGYLMEAEEIFNPATIVWAMGIVAAIIIVRAIQLMILREKLMPLLFVAPRGLITILLFLSIPASKAIPLVNNSLIIQVIVLTALVMMVGLMIHRKKPEDKPAAPIIADDGTM